MLRRVSRASLEDAQLDTASDSATPAPSPGAEGGGGGGGGEGRDSPLVVPPLSLFPRRLLLPESLSSRPSGLDGPAPDTTARMPQFVDESLPKEALESMEQLRRNEELCDVELVADEQCFRAHRVVLAASSMYFRAMFCRQMAESGQRRVVIQGVEPDALASLIKFTYTCSLEINEDNAQSLLAASNFLQMLRAREACCKFLQERLDCSNCLDIADFAEFQSCGELLEAALVFARRNFTEVSKNERFAQISYTRVKHFLTSNDLHLPEGEEAVFQALVVWARHNLSERQSQFVEMLNLVKLPLIGQEFFAVEVAASPLVSSSESCMKLIREAARALYNTSYPDGLSHLCRLPTQIPMKWWPRETLRAGEVIHILGECGWGWVCCVRVWAWVHVYMCRLYIEVEVCTRFTAARLQAETAVSHV